MLSVTCPLLDTMVSTIGTGTHDPTLYLSVGPGASCAIGVRVHTDETFVYSPRLPRVAWRGGENQ